MHQSLEEKQKGQEPACSVIAFWTDVAKHKSVLPALSFELQLGTFPSRSRVLNLISPNGFYFPWFVQSVVQYMYTDSTCGFLLQSTL